MVMVLRELGIPARFVTGYLPGERADDGSYVVPDQALHAWVEVYFPGIGWVRFDPTPGATLSRLQQQPTDFAEGDVIPSPIPGDSPLPAEAVAPISPAVEPSPSPGDEAAGSGAFESLGADPLTVLGLTVVSAALVLVALGLSLARLRRLPVADGSLAFGRIVGLATRLGHGPHPSQTEYEFASSLGEALPAVREDLHLVAGARVEARYGRRRAPSIGAPALRRAYGRVRLALVRWALRRDR
jgi:hypothetical protein